MNNTLSAGDAEEMPFDEKPLWFIPHHEVFHPRSIKLESDLTAVQLT
jgi:hypothetical protein